MLKDRRTHFDEVFVIFKATLTSLKLIYIEEYTTFLKHKILFYMYIFIISAPLPPGICLCLLFGLGGAVNTAEQEDYLTNDGLTLIITMVFIELH